MYKFGSTSRKRMIGVDKRLLEVVNEALDWSSVDMTIPWMGGLRTDVEQKNIYDNGNSRADGYRNKSYHQSGLAIDVIPWIGDSGSYTAKKEILYFANIMFAIFNYKKVIKEIDSDIYLHWGGFWGAQDKNKDGLLSSLDDKTGWDLAHYELRSSPQERVLTIKDINI
jgi:hypothetical protein